jgi:hypothetical protein
VLPFKASVLDVASDEAVFISIPAPCFARSIATGARVVIRGIAAAAAPAPAIAIIKLSYIN